MNPIGPVNALYPMPTTLVGATVNVENWFRPFHDHQRRPAGRGHENPAGGRRLRRLNRHRNGGHGRTRHRALVGNRHTVARLVCLGLIVCGIIGLGFTHGP